MAAGDLILTITIPAADVAEAAAAVGWKIGLGRSAAKADAQKYFTDLLKEDYRRFKGWQLDQARLVVPEINPT